MRKHIGDKPKTLLTPKPIPFLWMVFDPMNEPCTKSSISEADVLCSYPCIQSFSGVGSCLDNHSLSYWSLRK